MGGTPCRDCVCRGRGVGAYKCGCCFTKQTYFAGLLNPHEWMEEGPLTVSYRCGFCRILKPNKPVVWAQATTGVSPFCEQCLLRPFLWLILGKAHVRGLRPDCGSTNIQTSLNSHVAARQLQITETNRAEPDVRQPWRKSSRLHCQKPRLHW